MTLTVITPPEASPVSLAEMKDHLRLGHGGEDALVSELILSATSAVENDIGKVLVARTLERSFQYWPKALSTTGFELLPGPVTGLSGVVIKGSDGPDEDATGRFQLNFGRLCLRPWSIAPPIPVGGHAVVAFEAGFDGQGAVPDDLKLAVKLVAAEAYLARGFDRGEKLTLDVAKEILDAHRRVRL